MGTLAVTCGFCRGTAVTTGVNRRNIEAIVAALYRQGWTGSLEHGGWLCSDDCRAWAAKDVTPVLRTLGGP